MQGLPRTRVAFAGDPQRFATWALSAPAAGITPLFVPAPADDARRNLEAFAPHVVVVLDVDAVPPLLYAGLGAHILGVAAPDEERRSETAPRTPEKAAPRIPRRTRLKLLLLRILRRAAPSGAQPRLLAAAEWRESALPEPARPPWDRLVAIDARAAGGRDLWRLIAPPVDDALYAAPRVPDHRARVLVAAPSTPYRERLLTEPKHQHDVRHIAHGITPETLPDLLADTDVAIALRPHEDAGFAYAVALHAAAGHLVVSDHAGHGLEPGTDVIQVDNDGQLADAVGAIRSAPGVHHRVRVRGHQKAQRFRASRVWPELLEDLLADLAAFDH